MIDTVERYAPGFKASILGRQMLSPLDLERTFGLTGGDIFHGALSLDQIVLGAADAGLCRLSRRRVRAFIIAAQARIPAAASPARRATTRRARSCGTEAGR